MPTKTYDLITSHILTSPTNTISLTGITQSYRDLRLVTSSDTSTQAYYRVRINGDTSNSYNGVRNYGNGVQGYSDSHTSQNLIFGYDTRSTTHGSFDFLDYSATDKYKNVMASLREPIGYGVYEWCWSWYNTNAITQLDIFEYSTGNLPVGFGVFLYGIAS